LKAVPEAKSREGRAIRERPLFALLFLKKWQQETLFLSFLSFYKETKPKKIVVARVARPFPALLPPGAAQCTLNDRLPFHLMRFGTPKLVNQLCRDKAHSIFHGGYNLL